MATDPFIVPDMIGEPILAWRAWRMKIEVEQAAVIGPISDSPDFPPVASTGTSLYPKIILSSINQGFNWEPRKVMVGICNPKSRTREEHDDSQVPMEGCTCGIHAMDSPLFLAKTGYISMIGPNKSDYLWGEIAMWGKIIQGETGLKSQFAYPKELILRKDALVYYTDEQGREVALDCDKLKDMLSIQYGIPVNIGNTIARPNKDSNEVIFKLMDGTYLRKGGNDGNR